jgi:hypothetical protein
LAFRFLGLPLELLERAAAMLSPLLFEGFAAVERVDEDGGALAASRRAIRPDSNMAADSSVTAQTREQGVDEHLVAEEVCRENVSENARGRSFLEVGLARCRGCQYLASPQIMSHEFRQIDTAIRDGVNGTWVAASDAAVLAAAGFDEPRPAAGERMDRALAEGQCTDIRHSARWLRILSAPGLLLARSI